MRLLATLLLLLALAALGTATPARAQTTGACDLGMARADLTYSGVHARLYNKGNLFFNGGHSQYEVPKGSGTHAIFTSVAWIGGYVGGELRVAADTYGSRYELYPGPLDAAGNPPTDCAPYDHIWKVTVDDLAAYEATGIATGDLAAWPVHLGAPVLDGDGIRGNYDLEAGDRPHVYGSETAFWVMNDVAGPHTSTRSDPIGLEVRVTAFTVASTDPDLHYGTFYRYALVYRGDEPFEDARFSIFTAPSLGDYTDDVFGSDTTRSLIYVYNYDNDDDDSYRDYGYGMNPPAVGIDFLQGAASSTHFFNNASHVTSIPVLAEEYYNYMTGRWADGTPLTEGYEGYGNPGPPVSFIYPGDPVEAAYWSALCPTPTSDCPLPYYGSGRGFVTSTPTFTLQPGEMKAVDVAILYARGDDHLDSITELRAASDAVQAAYDGGTLFQTAAPLPVTLPAPDLLDPPEGSVIDGVPLAWTAVPGADLYRVEVATSPEFSNPAIYFPTEPTLTGYTRSLPQNEVLPVYWRVRAEAESELGAFSEPRSFVHYRYGSDEFGGGTGIVETANPAFEDVCAADPADPGCAAGYPGNTVWLDPNATGDYLLTAHSNFYGAMVRYANVFQGDSFEIRFTEACTEPGACLGVFASFAPGIGPDLIASVPFELWNTGPVVEGADDPGDEVRMIPFLRTYPETEPSAEWADTFPATQDVFVAGDTLALAVTQPVIGVMPDREDGYARFAEAAAGFGGPGATYDPTADGDTQAEFIGTTGEPCRSQGYYAAFCWRGASDRFVGPIGGLDGFLFADLAGDGTTPPAGTTIRLQSNEVLAVDAEGGGLSGPSAFEIEGVWPNPLRSSATVAYRMAGSADVRLAVYDVLGRRVAVLHDGPQPAGEHRARFEARGLAGGLYLVVLEAGGERHTKRVLVVR